MAAISVKRQADSMAVSSLTSVCNSLWRDRAYATQSFRESELQRLNVISIFDQSPGRRSPLYLITGKDAVRIVLLAKGDNITITQRLNLAGKLLENLQQTCSGDFGDGVLDEAAFRLQRLRVVCACTCSMLQQPS